MTEIFNKIIMNSRWKIMNNTWLAKKQNLIKIHDKTCKIWGITTFFSTIVAVWPLTVASFSEFTPLRGQSERRVLKARYKRISFLLKNEIKTFRITSCGFQHFYVGVHVTYSKFSFLNAPPRCLNAVGMNIKALICFCASFKDTLRTTV